VRADTVRWLILTVRWIAWAVGIAWLLAVAALRLLRGRPLGWEDGTPGASAEAVARLWAGERAWAWRIGALGEQRAAAELRRLCWSGWYLLWDRGIHGSRVNVDGVAIGERGVAVIDVKYLAGPVTCRDGVLYNGPLPFDLGGVAYETVAVARALGCHWVDPVVCVEHGRIRRRGYWAQQGSMRIFVGSSAAVRRRLRRATPSMTCEAAEELAQRAAALLPRRLR
jgi:Nuclease-related domain